ncbi:MAG: TetR/AcrR family transcriptional regulator [Pseudomonadales bacterium]
MSNRQKIGLRKAKPPTTRAPGRLRRQKLLDAARALLIEQPIEDISFRDIAKRADVPEGSAYHFFANRFDLFAELACELNDEFVAAHHKPVPASKRKTWGQLAAHMVDVGACVYADNPAARQLFIGGKTPPEVKQAERINDRDVVDAMHDSFARYFDIAETQKMRDAFYYFIEITDLLFSLSMVEHGKITPGMLKEAKRAGVAYLKTYENN